VNLESGRAQQEATPARSARGGTLARTAHYQFEVFSYTTGLRIFVTDPAGAAMSASALRGTATFYHPNSPRPWFARPLRPAPVQPGRAADSLDLAMDLNTVPTSGATVTLEVAGLPDPAELTAKFTMPFSPVAGAPGSSRAGQAATPAPNYRVSAEKVHYFPIVGFHQTTSGVNIWIPSPGHYHGTPAQYSSRTLPSGASGWRPAHPANDPGRAVPLRGTGVSELTQSEFYWRPRALGNTASFDAWMIRQIRRQQAARRPLPTVVAVDCAKCHRR
jgi:hypothetical protein